MSEQSPATGDPPATTLVVDLDRLRRRAEPALDAATRSAARLLGAPTSVVSVITEEQQLFAGCHGLGEDLHDAGGTPVEWSLCRLVVDRSDALSVADALADPDLRGEYAVTDLGVRAYLGVPLRGPGDLVVGALCVTDGLARQWTAEDQRLLADLALLVEHVFLSRATAEGLLRRLDDQRDVVRTLVHDIRQPLSSASGAAQLLEYGAEGHEELVGLVTSGVERADRLLQQLGSSRSEGPRPVALSEVVPSACVSSGATESDRLRLDVAEDAIVLGILEDVERIVSNLVGNAFVHGGPTVRVHVRAWRSFDGVVLEVEDDGPGIAAADHDRIFELGVRRSTDTEGQGLGLHVVRSLAQRTGGDVDLDSRPGRGATFRVRLRDLDDDEAATIDVSADE